LLRCARNDALIHSRDASRPSFAQQRPSKHQRAQGMVLTAYSEL
jgi:hypothetical protein